MTTPARRSAFRTALVNAKLGLLYATAYVIVVVTTIAVIGVGCAIARPTWQFLAFIAGGS